MTPKDKVYVGIRGKVPGKGWRAIGSPPDLGNVSRMPRAYHKGRGRWRKSRGSRRKVKVPYYVKVLSLVVLGLVVIGVPLVLWIQGRFALDEDIEDAKPKSQEVVRVVGKFVPPNEDDAIRLVKQALAARNVADLKKTIRMGETSAKEIVEFLGTLEAKEGKQEQLDWLAGMDANGLQIEGVLVRFGDKHSRLAMLTPDESGTWHMDYDSFARKVRPDWARILSSPDIEATVRVYVGMDSYYNGDFDEASWKSYAMGSPDNADMLLTGYVKPGSSQHIALESILGGKKNRAVIRIRHTAAMGPRQYEIIEVIAEDWIVGGTVYDHRFTPNSGMMAEPPPSGGS